MRREVSRDELMGVKSALVVVALLTTGGLGQPWLSTIVGNVSLSTANWRGTNESRTTTPTPPSPPPPADDHFISWFRGIIDRNEREPLQEVFGNDSLPGHVSQFEHLADNIVLPDAQSRRQKAFTPNIRQPLHSAQGEADRLFEHLNFPLDARCTSDKSSWWYRTQDGSCNWLKQGEANIGSIGTAKSRDYNQHTYADGVSNPREGPNARAVSNAFFKRKKKLYYDHTPMLIGLVEFLMHDVTYSQDSATEFVDVPMPEDEESFGANTTFRVWRTAPVPGTGTSETNPREIINMATTWLDLSALYGSTLDVAHKLRTHQGGKLVTQEVKARGTKKSASYLPYNYMNVSTNTRPGVNPQDLFAGGDPRTNEDWMMLGLHTLFLREHNRLCDILAKQKPGLDDEQLYQTVRLIMSSKYALIANSYQMAYWTDKMPWPRDDGYPLYRELNDFGPTELLEIGPANTYPWPLVTKNGKPMTVSAEMAVVYRFHEFIISKFPIMDAAGETLWEQDLFSTGFNSTGFVDAGLENVLRGMASSTIPNFKSGVDENFRSAGRYRGKPFDIVVWSIIHEREQGLPTFNQYFREYNKQDPEHPVPIRDEWHKFSTDPEMVENLRKLYNHPDDVDLVVGVQLDENLFPGTTIPQTALIISLISLFGMGNSDRFSIGFAMMRCLLVDKPWDCHPSNALEDLLWEPRHVPGFPDYRFYSSFWMKEFDIQNHGSSLLWRLITENSEIDCLQTFPLFPPHDKTNPVICAQPGEPANVFSILLLVLQVFTTLFRQRIPDIAAVLTALIAVGSLYHSKQESDTPPVLKGWWVLGEAIAFFRDPMRLVRAGFAEFGGSASRCFGIQIGWHKHYVITRPEDLEMMRQDNKFEVKFSRRKFMELSGLAAVLGRQNFESDLHARLVRTHLGDPGTLAAFAGVMDEASKEFIRRRPLAGDGGGSTRHESINEWVREYVMFVVARCVVGPEGFDNAELLKKFQQFGEHAGAAMKLSSVLPRFLQWIAALEVKRDLRAIQQMILPIIANRRTSAVMTKEDGVFLDFILEAVRDDRRAADLATFLVWSGLSKLQTNTTHVLYDIINDVEGQARLLPTLTAAHTSNLDVFAPAVPPPPSSPSPWTPLRSAMLESVRLAGSATGPARGVLEDVHLASQPGLRLPRGSVATLSPYATHRDADIWGADAARYSPARFVDEDPKVGGPAFISWGLEGPHMCPGRWFAQAAMMILVKNVMQAYEFCPETRVEGDERYEYTSAGVQRVPVAMEVSKRWFID